MENETMVNSEANEAAEEVLSEELVEEAEDNSESLESALSEDEGEQSGENTETAQSQGTRQEPGYVKTRIDKAVARAIAETEARMTAQFEKQMAPYKEHMLNMEAQELVRSGRVKDLETAKELVRYRQGQPQPEREEQPRNDRGQFSAKQDPAVSVRVDMLAHQAERIKASRGIDVISEFQNNEDIKQKVISGELDFYEVAEMMEKRPAKKKASAPMRSPNGASGSEKSTIANMTDEQLEKLEKKISGGARYSLR